MMPIFINILMTTLESASFVVYFLKCHKNKYPRLKISLIMLFLIINGLLPSLFLHLSYSLTMLISLLGLFIIFFIFFSKYIIDFALSISIVYLIIISSNMISDFIIVRFLKLNIFNNIYEGIILGISIEFIALSLFLYNIKYFVILHNRIMQSKKAFLVISFSFMFVLFFIAGILFDKNTNIYGRVVLVIVYLILFVLSFASIIKDYISVCDQLQTLEKSQQITSQFQTIHTKYAIQFSKLLGMTQLKQYDNMENTIKDFIQQNSNDNITITNNSHPILVSSLEYFYNNEKIEVIIDNEADLTLLKVNQIKLLDALNSISKMLNVIMQSVNSSKSTLLLKTRDYYDEIEFNWIVKEKTLNKGNEYDISNIIKFDKLKERLKNIGRIKFKNTDKKIVIKLYLSKK